MKINNCKYVSNKEIEKFLKNLHIDLVSTSDIIHVCNTVIIKKNDVNYVIKDRYKDPFKSKEENINEVLKHNYKIMSKSIFDKIKRLNSIYNIIEPGNNIIIDCD